MVVNFARKKNTVLSHDDTIVVSLLYIETKKAFIKTCLLGGCARVCIRIIVIAFHVFIL